MIRIKNSKVYKSVKERNDSNSCDVCEYSGKDLVIIDRITDDKLFSICKHCLNFLNVVIDS